MKKFFSFLLIISAIISLIFSINAFSKKEQKKQEKPVENNEYRKPLKRKYITIKL